MSSTIKLLMFGHLLKIKYQIKKNHANSFGSNLDILSLTKSCSLKPEIYCYFETWY